MVRQSKKPKKIITRMTSQTVLLSQEFGRVFHPSWKSHEDRFWMHECSTNGQPMVDQYEDTTVETTDVGCTFAGGETHAARTKIWTLHAEIPQRIAVNVVSNKSNTFSHRSGCDP